MKKMQLIDSVENNAINNWRLQDFENFWFGDGTMKNRGLIGDALRWLRYSKNTETQKLVLCALQSQQFEAVCSAFGYDPEVFYAHALNAIREKSCSKKNGRICSPNRCKKVTK